MRHRFKVQTMTCLHQHSNNQPWSSHEVQKCSFSVLALGINVIQRYRKIVLWNIKFCSRHNMIPIHVIFPSCSRNLVELRHLDLDIGFFFLRPSCGIVLKSSVSTTFQKITGTTSRHVQSMNIPGRTCAELMHSTLVF